MQLLNIALAQIQLPPNYGPNYQRVTSAKSPGGPKSPVRQARAARLLKISREIGESNVDELLAVYRLDDDGLHKDDARKILDEMAAEGKMDKRTVTKLGRRRALYRLSGKTCGNRASEQHPENGFSCGKEIRCNSVKMN